LVVNPALTGWANFYRAYGARSGEEEPKNTVPSKLPSKIGAGRESRSVCATGRGDEERDGELAGGAGGDAESSEFGGGGAGDE